MKTRVLRFLVFLFVLVNFIRVDFIAKADDVEKTQKGEGWEIIKTYKTDFNYYVAIKNTGSKDKDIDIRAVFYDKEGKIISKKRVGNYAFGKEQVGLFSFHTDIRFDKVDLSVSLSNPNLYASAHSVLESHISIVQGRAVISVKNTGDKPVKFVQYWILVSRDDGKLSCEEGYLPEIKPNTNVVEESTYHSELKADQKVELYIWGVQDR